MPVKQPPLKPLERSIFGHLSNWILGLWSRIQKAWFRWADLNQHSPWFPFLIGAVVALDAIIVVLPGDVLVALAVLSNPAAWKRLAVYAGLGGALGAFVLYVLLAQFGKAPLDQLASLGAPTGVERLNEQFNADQPDLDAGLAAVTNTQPPKWDKAREFFNRFGLFSLALGSVLPFFSWPPVILAGLSTDRWWEVLFWLLLGRQARYWIGCFGVREGWAMFQSLREEAEERRRNAGQKQAKPRRKRAAR